MLLSVLYLWYHSLFFSGFELIANHIETSYYNSAKIIIEKMEYSLFYGLK